MSHHPSIRTSPRSKAVQVPRAQNAPSQLTIRHSVLAPEEEQQAGDEFGHGAIAGPSSPSRRRRRPSVSRRRSSSITAAASLISSYSTSPQERHDPTASKYPNEARQNATETSLNNDEDEYSTEEGFGEDAFETAREASTAFRLGRSSPYHMALVSLFFSLAQGMPLASQFKVYSYMMCQVYQKQSKGAHHLIAVVNKLFPYDELSTSSFAASKLPSAPELPSDPVCDGNNWVENATSTYAAAMAMVGALLSLMLLNRCSRLSDYFGRKPLLLLTQTLLALSMTVFRLSVLFPTYIGVTVLYVAVMVMEASAGAPFKIAVQNYVMDTTSESQQAGALSFTDGFGQIGAFPSSTLGGWLAAVSQEFFSPFYASIADYVASTLYVLLFVPESKKDRHHTLIDDFERVGNDDSNEQQDEHAKGDNEADTSDDDSDGGIRSESYTSSVYVARHGDPWWRSVLYRVNFLSPLTVFLPQFQNPSVWHRSLGRKWRLFTLAILVVLEESFQVFMIPILLLYNTNVFKYDVVQNGYLVSLLQGVRALYLTICFPWAVRKIRAYFRSNDCKAMPDNRTREADDQRTALLHDSSEHGTEEANAADQREERGKLDIGIMLFSYLLCAASFGLLALTRSWSEKYDAKETTIPPWVGVAVAIVGLQIGAGATSLRTALLVHAVSEQADEQEELQHRQNVQRRNYGSTLRQQQQRERHEQERRLSELRISRAGSSYLDHRLNDRASYKSSSSSSPSFHAHHERHQSKALAANQILSAVVYALLPMATSQIFGAGVNVQRPELVWIFKCVISLLSAVCTLVLWFTYTNNNRHGNGSGNGNGNGNGNVSRQVQV